jgi:hypothetical protein
VAVSYWHVTLSRMGLRIVLTVMITALLLIWLARGMRENRRGYFILAGLMLGVGLYMYQAVRMLPVVVIAAGALMLLAWLWGLIFKRGEARPTAGDGLRIVYHFSVLVIVSAVVFVPLFAYSLQYPELFWMRTAGRLLGDDVITETDAAGNIIQRSPTQAERDAAFNANMATLASNIRNALLMYNWKGDVAWISAASNYPAMDPFTGALLLVGIPAWGARMVRRRDPVDWLIPLALFIMLLPSALSIAFPIENPSATRTSGTIPTAYLIAALPLSLIALLVWRLVEGNIGRVLAGLMVACVVVGALLANRHTYFFLYRAFYMDASLPYSEAGRVLRGFAESDGGYGNAFMIGYPYWWDDRALWLEAGIPDFHNGINTDNTTIAEYVVRAATCTEGLYMLRPDRGLLFFLSDQDTENLAELGRLFPEGRSERRESYQPNDAYVLFRVPSLGVEGWQSFAERNAPQAVCP